MGSITVESVGKAYKQYPSSKARLLEWLLPFRGPRHTAHWVLQNVSFSVAPGEAVGIAGVNGAGKSTLLKMIAGTVRPSAGQIHIEGRVAAMLELGMGFHPEFTGRQNAYMAGQLQGLSIEEINQLMPEIEAFAEIGEYIDQPLRTYSSGMQVRLAFSVATAKRPDLLIVDEALSVGDAYFQHKSFDRIREFRREGTTLLIVSHNRSAIQSICDRVILLGNGGLLRQGEPDVVLDFYNAMLAERESELISQKTLSDGSVQTVSGTGEAAIDTIRLLNESGKPVETVRVGQTVTLEVSVLAKSDLPRLVLGFLIKDNFGQPIYGINTHRANQAVDDLRAGASVVYRFSFEANFGKGNYSVSLSASKYDSHLDKNYQWIDRALVFHVINVDKEDFVGCNWLNARVETEKLNDRYETTERI